MEPKILITVILAFYIWLKFGRRKSSTRSHQPPKLIQQPGNISLEPDEIKLTEKLQMDANIALTLKRTTGNNIEGLFIRHLSDEREPELAGIKSVIEKKTMDSIGKSAERHELVTRLKPEVPGYQAFCCGGHSSEANYCVGLIKSNDPFDVLRVQETDAPNYGISHDQVVDFFKRCYHEAKFEFLEVDADTVIIRFEDLHPDLDKFCSEAIAFCPDMTENDDANWLKQNILQTRTASFWWD